MAIRDKLADALQAALISPGEVGSDLNDANVVDGLFAIARALNGVATALERLGMNNAESDFGAVEDLSMQVKAGFETLATQVGGVADALSDLAANSNNDVPADGGTQ